MAIAMVDSAYAPTLEQAKPAAASGVKLWGGYVHAGAYHAWTKTDFDTIRAAGIKPVFIHCGTDGHEAVTNAKVCGAAKGDILALDVEAGWTDIYWA
jgi:hypothetical protein